MKFTQTKTAMIATISAIVMMMSTGCDELVLSNIASGAREGTLTAATGIIEGFFEDRFGLAPAEDGGDAGTEEETEEGGDGLFIRL